MNTSWLHKTRTVAVVDRMVVNLELPAAIPRAALASCIPRANTRHDRLAPRWNLRAHGDDGLHYRVTIQDPPPIPRLVTIFDELASSCTLSYPPQIELLEVAVDTYPLEPNSLDLERVVADIFKGAKFSPSDNVRGSGAYRGSGMSLLGEDGAYRALRSNRTLYQGDSREDYALRWYVKRTDDAGRFMLPASEHRGRFEIEYRREGLPVSSSSASAILMSVIGVLSVVGDVFANATVAENPMTPRKGPAYASVLTPLPGTQPNLAVRVLSHVPICPVRQRRHPDSATQPYSNVAVRIPKFAPYGGLYPLGGIAVMQPHRWKFFCRIPGGTLYEQAALMITRHSGYY